MTCIVLFVNPPQLGISSKTINRHMPKDSVVKSSKSSFVIGPLSIVIVTVLSFTTAYIFNCNCVHNDLHTRIALRFFLIYFQQKQLNFKDAIKRYITVADIALNEHDVFMKSYILLILFI